MMRGHDQFKTVCMKAAAVIHNYIDDLLILSNEGCGKCIKCTYPDSPCIFPESLFPSIESYGVAVNHLAATANIHYINGKDTVTYFGAILYNE